MKRLLQKIINLFIFKKIKVDFIVCGAQKGGTSALDQYLREHPCICMANKKEVHFFDHEKYFKFPPLTNLFYHHQFQPSSETKIIGEATPIYMYWHNAIERIWKYNPNMKLILILRNPIDRAYSHWNMERSRKKDFLPFGEAIRNEHERCKRSLPLQDRVFSYIDRGYYAEQIRRIWRFFPKKMY